jgi:hypothetical protein
MTKRGAARPPLPFPSTKEKQMVYFVAFLVALAALRVVAILWWFK